MLKVTNLQTVYNDVIVAIKGVSLEVPEGSIVTLLGANGTGKTTLLRSISGVLKSMKAEIEEGSITFLGQQVIGKDPDEIVRLGLCQVPEGRRIFADLTVAENLRLGAYLRHDRAGIRADLRNVLDLFPPLAPRLSLRAGFLSGGEQQMLAIGRALMARPRLLMLDEPSLGLAPILVEEIFARLRRLNTELGLTILLIEQNANLALKLASYGYIMENGRVVLDGPSQKLLANEDVKEFYLGLTETAQRRSYAEVKHYKRRKRWLS
ncbi:MAG: ABC transporter ATP-binding protein [Candidatus Tectomicrobia bacterium]|nr:ABC transporter ATP-binding protein [Candidatus Tectomicrobia bacterium]